MPRDEQSRRKARTHARIALIMCVLMFAALTPVFAALSKNAITSARAQVPPLPTCGTPPIMQCPTGGASPSGSASASRSPSASASASASASRSPSGTSSASASATQSSSPSTTPSATPSRSPSPSQTSPSPSASSSQPPQTFNSPSDITIKHRKGTNKFSGRVNSDFDECEPGRRVKLFYVVPGFGTSRAVGKGKTKGNGTYSITEKNPKGKYFTSVKPRRINLPNGDTILCRKDRSKRVKG